MSLELLIDDKKIFDYDEELVCKNCKTGLKLFIPSRDDLLNEIERHFYRSHKAKKKCRSYTTNKVKKWLIEKPVIDIIDIKFIKLKEYCFRKITSDSNKESNKLKELLKENKVDR